MKNSKTEQDLNQKEQERQYLKKQEKMRCIEIASRLGLQEDRNAESVIKEANLLYDYFNR